jgi:hypothetical protein
MRDFDTKKKEPGRACGGQEIYGRKNTANFIIDPFPTAILSTAVAVSYRGRKEFLQIARGPERYS